MTPARVFLSAIIVWAVVAIYSFGPIAWSDACDNIIGKPADDGDRAFCAIMFSAVWPVYWPLRASWLVARPASKGEVK